MTTTLKDAKLWIGGYDLSGDHNTLTVSAGKDTPEVTAFGADSHAYLADGLRSVTVDQAGFYDADSTDPQVDDRLWAEYTATGLTVMSFAAVGAAGDIGYAFNGIEAGYSPFQGAVGDPHTFAANAQGTGDAVRGTVMEAGVTARSSSSDSAEYELGDLVAGEQAYAALHVIATTGTPTLDVTIESDTTGFPSPTTQGTFTQATDQAAEFIAIDPTVADTFWRTAWVFGGSGSVTFVVIFGIN